MCCVNKLSVFFYIGALLLTVMHDLHPVLVFVKLLRACSCCVSHFYFALCSCIQKLLHPHMYYLQKCVSHQPLVQCACSSLWTSFIKKKKNLSKNSLLYNADNLEQLLGETWSQGIIWFISKTFPLFWDGNTCYWASGKQTVVESAWPTAVDSKVLFPQLGRETDRMDADLNGLPVSVFFPSGYSHSAFWGSLATASMWV